MTSLKNVAPLEGRDDYLERTTYIGFKKETDFTYKFSDHETEIINFSFYIIHRSCPITAVSLG